MMMMIMIMMMALRDWDSRTRDRRGSRQGTTANQDGGEARHAVIQCRGFVPKDVFSYSLHIDAAISIERSRAPRKQYFRSPVLRNSSANIVAKKNLGNWHTMYLSESVIISFTLKLGFELNVGAEVGFAFLIQAAIATQTLLWGVWGQQWRQPLESIDSGLCSMSSAVPARKLLSSGTSCGTT